MPATIGKGFGTVVESKDDEYDQYAAQFAQLDVLARKLSEDSKRFKDSLGLMLVHQTDLADGFVDVFAKSGDAQHTVASNFSTAMKNARETLSEDLTQIERLVVQPTGDYLVLLDQVKVFMTKRSHKQLDYDRHRASVEKLKLKPARSISEEKTLGQYENNLDQATREFNNINNLLKQELPVLLNLRIDFIDPCLLTFYNYQVKVFHTLYGIFYQAANDHFDLSTTALGSYENKQSQVAALLTQLNIPKRHQKTPEPSIAMPPPSYSSANVAMAAIPAAAADTGMSSKSAAQIPASAGPEFAVALYDFLAQAPGDLSFRKGDRIELVEKKDNANDWWVGRFNNQVGQFPGTACFKRRQLCPRNQVGLLTKPLNISHMPITTKSALSF